MTGTLISVSDSIYIYIALHCEAHINKSLHPNTSTIATIAIFTLRSFLSSGPQIAL